MRYDESALTGAPTHQALANGEPIGKRFHSAPVVRAADAMEMQLGHVHDADGRFRVYILAGTDKAPAYDLATWLASDPASPVVRYRRDADNIDAVIDVRTVVQETFDTIDLSAAPPAAKPAKGRLGLHDHEKLFCIDPKPGRNIYELRGIDKDRGCAILVRPDQYIGQVLPLSDTAGIAAYFDGILS